MDVTMSVSNSFMFSWMENSWSEIWKCLHAYTVKTIFGIISCVGFYNCKSQTASQKQTYIYIHITEYYVKLVTKHLFLFKENCYTILPLPLSRRRKFCTTLCRTGNQKNTIEQNGFSPLKFHPFLPVPSYCCSFLSSECSVGQHKTALQKSSAFCPVSQGLRAVA